MKIWHNTNFYAEGGTGVSFEDVLHVKKKEGVLSELFGMVLGLLVLWSLGFSMSTSDFSEIPDFLESPSLESSMPDCATTHPIVV